MEKSWNCIFEFLWEPCMYDLTIHMQLSSGVNKVFWHELEFTSIFT